ncbi:protein kinase [Actinokineospora soli]|uniref:Protein kinase n=1 Tax=Actinokineospora soli TaxID=1048753 RepID=A0ABW2TL76_9PSEU
MRETGLIGALLEQRYRVDAPLARGGMSAVYRGVDTRLDRPVAIKVMDPRFASDASFVERFEREARSAARIHHPNVVAVHDQGLDGDHVYLVMELVDGGTLRDLLTERGALPPPLAVSILEPVLAALAAAHAADLVHRDVKPENVLIGANGVVKVADFGLVRALSSPGTTKSSVILGTVSYLSPEQVTTGNAAPRGDVYSAGILLYEMLTGAPPYVGDNPLSVAYRHANDDVPPPSAVTRACRPPSTSWCCARPAATPRPGPRTARRSSPTCSRCARRRRCPGCASRCRRRSRCPSRSSCPCPSRRPSPPPRSRRRTRTARSPSTSPPSGASRPSTTPRRRCG